MSRGAPELLFTNGRVLIGDKGPSNATVAVRGGRISAVGGDDLRALAGAGTEVVDLAGGLLIPGFQDAHVHPVQAGLELLSCDLSVATTLVEILQVVGTYAATRPELSWITGGGWSMSAFAGGVPLAADLDAVDDGRPILLINRDHHSAWANQRALSLAGIDASTPDPSTGRIERDTAGNPSGALHDGAIELVGRLLPERTDEEMLEALLEAQQHMHAWGITAWQDALVGTSSFLRNPASTYFQAEASGQLTGRVVAAQWWEHDRGLDQVADMIKLREQAAGSRLVRASTVKLMLDGVLETQTAHLVEPYLENGPCCAAAHRGLAFIEAADLTKYVEVLAAEDFQVHVHAVGDAAVSDALDAFESAHAADGGRDLRHHIAHLQVILDRDVARFRELDVVANLQPLWAAYEQQMTELVIPVLGEDRARHQFLFGDLAASGSRLASGSDWPVTSGDPLQGIHVAVNRRRPGFNADPPLLPNQALDLATALRAYTAGSAYVNHLDDTGQIALGMLADLAVLDRDPFAAPAEEIADTRVVQTFVGGARVFGV